MKRLPMGKKAIWLDEFEIQVLGGFIAELLDRKSLDSYQIEILQNVYDQLEQEQEKGKMKIRELIEELLKRNDLDSEIIVTYWDKAYFVEGSDLQLNKVDVVWTEFVKQGQETLEDHLDFLETGYDLAYELQELIEEKDKGNE